MPTLSVCMIVKNEEECLRDCLESIKPIADELIIVDTGSTDKTIDIAKKFGAKIFHCKWQDDFSFARNESLKHATKDWVLYLDADEVISQNDLKLIKECMNQDEIMGFLCDQRNYTDDTTFYGWQPCDIYAECRGKGFFVSKITRLFRNHKNITFKNKVHEEVDTSILAQGGKIIHVKIPIHHYGYLKGELALEKKRDLYLKLGLEDMREQPDHPKGYYEVGKIYKMRNRLDEAEGLLRKAASLDPLYKLVWTNLGDVLVRLNRVDEAILAYERAIQSKPQNENAYINLGMVYVKKSELSKSAKLFSDAVRANHRSEAAYTNLILVLTKIGDLKRLHGTLISAIGATGLIKFKQSYKVYEEKYPHQAFLFTKFLDNKFADAEVYIRAQLKKEPTNHFFVGMLGIALAKQDNKEKRAEAKIILQKAIALDPPGKKSLEAELAKLESRRENKK